VPHCAASTKSRTDIFPIWLNRAITPLELIVTARCFYKAAWMAPPSSVPYWSLRTSCLPRGTKTLRPTSTVVSVSHLCTCATAQSHLLVVLSTTIVPRSCRKRRRKTMSVTFNDKIRFSSLIWMPNKQRRRKLKSPKRSTLKEKERSWKQSSRRSKYTHPILQDCSTPGSVDWTAR